MFKGFNIMDFDDMLFLLHYREEEIQNIVWKVWFGCVVLALLVWGMAGFWLAAAFLVLSMAATIVLIVWGLNRRAMNVWRDQLWMYN